MAPGPLEEKIREHPLVGQAVVVGDGRPFVAALVSLDPEGLEHWCAAHRQCRASALPKRRRTTPVRAAVQEAVDQANRLAARSGVHPQFRILDADFTVESGHLTPSLKLKRAAVVSDFGAQIDRIYG